jgi:hypothetical protein
MKHDLFHLHSIKIALFLPGIENESDLNTLYRFLESGERIEASMKQAIHCLLDQRTNLLYNVHHS